MSSQPFELVALLVLSTLWAATALHVGVWLRCERGVKVGYTRKLFHLFIFVPAAGVQLATGLLGLYAFGVGVSLAIFAVLLRGEGSYGYEGIARDSDAPRRTYFVVVPYLSTLVGGLLANALFGAAAIAGYLVTGVADAIAEPVGTRWGRHPYRVASLGGITSRRTLEGSASVFAASALALFAAACLLEVELGLLALVGMSAVCTAVEAASPHGSDNATLLLAASGLIWAVA